MIPKVFSQGKGDPIIQAAAIIMLAAACEKGKQAVALGNTSDNCYGADMDKCIACMKKRVFELAGELKPKSESKPSELKPVGCWNCGRINCPERGKQRAGCSSWQPQPEVTD